MTDREQYLSAAEKEALDNDALRQQAKAIDAYLSVAALTALSNEQLTQGIEVIRQSDKTKAKRIHVSLAHAAETLETLLSTSTDVEPELQDPLVEEPHEDDVNSLGEQASEDDVPNLDQKLAEDDDVSQKGKEYLRAVLGDDFGGLAIEGLSVEEIAKHIYQLAGAPHTRSQKGKPKIDPIQRISDRIRGMSNEEIALSSDTNAHAVYVWFYQFHEKISRKAREQSENNVQADKVAGQPDGSGHPSDQEIAGEPLDALIRTALSEQDFNGEEIEEILRCTTFGGEGNPRLRSETARNAFRKLQVLLANNGEQLVDQRARSSISMLTNVAFGVNTIDDIQRRLRQNDPALDNEAVEQLTRRGILQLAAV